MDNTNRFVALFFLLIVGFILMDYTSYHHKLDWADKHRGSNGLLYVDSSMWDGFPIQTSPWKLWTLWSVLVLFIGVPSVIHLVGAWSMFQKGKQKKAEFHNEDIKRNR